MSRDRLSVWFWMSCWCVFCRTVHQGRPGHDGAKVMRLTDTAFWKKVELHDFICTCVLGVVKKKERGPFLSFSLPLNAFYPEWFPLSKYNFVLIFFPKFVSWLFQWGSPNIECQLILITMLYDRNQEYMRTRVGNSILWGLHVTAEFEVRHRWRTNTLFSGCYALNAEHVHARLLQKLHLFDWHFRLVLHFTCTSSSKYSVQHRAERSRINVFPFLVQTDVGSDDELRILPWQHS